MAGSLQEGGFKQRNMNRNSTMLATSQLDTSEGNVIT